MSRTDAGLRVVLPRHCGKTLPIMSGEVFVNSIELLFIFLAFSVILVTLVGQGLTLPWLVRVLRVSDPAGPNLEEEAARREVLQAALAYLEESRKKSEAEFDAIYEDLAGHYRQRLAAVTGKDDTETGISPKHQKHLSRLSRDLLRIERKTAVRLRDEGQINDETLRQLQYELDLREAGPTHAETVRSSS